MHIYTLAYIVYILRERVTFSRQSSTYNQPFNKWHIQIKSQQLYLIARLCCFSHFICAFNNKFSWSLAIHCYQLWGIRDNKHTGNRHGTQAQKIRPVQPEQRPNDKRSSKIARLCHRSHPNIWSGRQSTAGVAPVPIKQDSPPRVNRLPSKAALGQATFQRHLCAAASRGAKRCSRGGGERGKERKGVSALKRQTDARLRPQRFTLTI